MREFRRRTAEGIFSACGRGSPLYSDRSASIGSARAARRAGRYVASNATTTNNPDIPAKVVASSALTSNRNPAIRRVAAADEHQAYDDSAERQPHALVHHQAEHVDRPRAERHANAHLARAAVDRVRNHAVQTERRQQQPAPPSVPVTIAAIRCVITAMPLACFQGDDRRNRQRGSSACIAARKLPASRARGRRRTNQQCLMGLPVLRHWKKRHRRRPLRERGVLRVARDADDGHGTLPNVSVRPSAEPPGAISRASVSLITTTRRRAIVVRVSEWPARDDRHAQRPEVVAANIRRPRRGAFAVRERDAVVHAARRQRGEARERDVRHTGDRRRHDRRVRRRSAWRGCCRSPTTATRTPRSTRPPARIRDRFSFRRSARAGTVPPRRAARATARAGQRSSSWRPVRAVFHRPPRRRGGEWRCRHAMRATPGRSRKSGPSRAIRRARSPSRANPASYRAAR